MLLGEPLTAIAITLHNVAGSDLMTPHFATHFPRLAQLSQIYRHTLLDDVIPFWMRHSLDKEFGGYHSSLDQQGNVVDSDKAIWVQGRMAWTFATLCLEVEPREEWLQASRIGIEFLERHGFSPEGRMYFLTERDGRPLRLRRHFFSESFAAIAYSAYGKASGQERIAQRGAAVFENYLAYAQGRKASPEKWDSRTRPGQSLAVRMIAIITAQVLRENQAYAGADAAIDWALADIRNFFVKPELGAVLEMVGPNGEIYDTFDGRQLNPGHALEAAWFILKEGLHRNDPSLKELALNIIDWMWERGWDREYGGLLYFTDLHGKPVQEYWHDMKFWWPHNEAEIALLMAWLATGEERFRQRLDLLHDYQFSLFPDSEYGEWFGYFHRDGRRSSSLKGNHWKSGFHLPRMLLTNHLLIENALLTTRPETQAGTSSVLSSAVSR